MTLSLNSPHCHLSLLFSSPKMAENLDSAASNLLCAENTMTCFDGDDDLDRNAVDGFGAISPFWHQVKTNNPRCKDWVFDDSGSNSLMGFPLESLEEMVEREKEHLPRDDYLKRLRSGDLELSARREALDWILKACSHYQFGPVSICLSMNYFDRFLSVYELPTGKAWTLQLLAVACLSLSAKMEETKVPQSVDLQVGDPKFVFEAKTIQRMELLVLNTLEWRLQVLTPCSFIDYFLSKISDDQLSISLSKSVQIILNTIKGIDFLEFRPSEMAASVAIFVSGEIPAMDIDNRDKSYFMHLEKGRVMKCVELIKDLTLITRSGSASSSSTMPQSPDGVLDGATCLSYKSDESTAVGSFTANCSSHNNNNNQSPDIKRRKAESRDREEVMTHGI